MLSFVGPVRVGRQIDDMIVIGVRIMERRWKAGKREVIQTTQGQLWWGSQDWTLYKLV